MRISGWAAGLISVFLLLALPVRAEDGLTRIPGTRISLEVPEHFIIADQFNGIIREDMAVSIVVAELPGPVAPLYAAYTAEKLATKNVQLEGWEEVARPLGTGRLYRGMQTQNGVQVRKWILLTGTEQHSVLLSANIPVMAEEEYGEMMKRIILEARWNPEEELAALPTDHSFEVDETADLKLRKDFSVGPVMAFSGDADAYGEGQVVPGVVIFAAPVVTFNRRLSILARKRMYSTPQIRKAKVYEKADIVIAGQPGHELLARASDSRTGVPVIQYLAVTVAEDKIYYIQGFVQEDEAEKYLPQFRQIRENFRFKE